MEELRDRQERVTAETTIELPILGIINVKGMNEREISDALRDRLKEYMKNPQVDVFIRQYRSREVAVGGMVQKPGLYTLTSRSDTILDMIGRAGGAKENASMRVVFIPALDPNNVAATMVPLSRFNAEGDSSAQMRAPNKGGEATALKPVSAIEPASRSDGTRAANTQSQDNFIGSDSSVSATDRDPIVIDLSTLNSNAELDAPVWPGDVIIVPAAGEVMVRGWVKNPGGFNISPGMTVLGAITAAGGELFSSSAELLRTAENGGRTATPIDLGKVQQGAEPDIPVESGDVVIVNRSVVGAVPYFVDSLFNKFTTGAYIPML
jgi:polysaccharide export outer membrane protein